MDTSNSQMGQSSVEDGGEVESRNVFEGCSERVGLLTSVRRIGCTELSPKEWADAINILMIQCRPLLQYIFTPEYDLKDNGKLKVFRFIPNFGCRDFVSTCTHWSEQKVKLADKASPFARAFKAGGRRVFEFCYTSALVGVGNRFLLTDKSQILCLECIRNDLQPSEILITDCCIVKNIVMLIEKYPQLGPHFALALASIFSLAVENKESKMCELRATRDHLVGFFGKLIKEGSYLEKNPGMMSEGLTVVREEVRL